ncbi:MAG: hypothetical protein V4625_04380 [Pseudomonadota bacterium]
MPAQHSTSLVPVVAHGQRGLVARVRQRLFPATSPTLPSVPDKLKAGIAELLLVNRLKARSVRRTQAREMLERASHIVFVTCKNWFSSSDGRTPERRNPL